MPRGDKSSYTSKQKRQARHIEEGYKKDGASSKKAERIAWATVNKETGGAGKSVKKSAAKKVGKSAAKSRAAKKSKSTKATSTRRSTSRSTSHSSHAHA